MNSLRLDLGMNGMNICGGIVISEGVFRPLWTKIMQCKQVEGGRRQHGRITAYSRIIQLEWFLLFCHRD